MFKLQVQDDDNDARVWHDVKGADGKLLTFEKETEARAKPLMTRPTCRTGICSTVMKTRNCVSSPMVIWPPMTRNPPTHNTRPIARK